MVRLAEALSPAARARLAELWSFIRAELPHSLGEPPFDSPEQLLLALRGRRVVGLLWAERVSGARLVEVADVEASDNMLDNEAAVQLAGIAASLGVALIWVRRSEQRRHLATSLVDAARKAGANLGCAEIPLEQVAFSQPTTQGFAFASRYLQKARSGKVLVYVPDWK